MPLPGVTACRVHAACRHRRSRGWIERGRIVVAVNADGSAVVERYNAGGGGVFSTQTVRAGAYPY